MNEYVVKAVDIILRQASVYSITFGCYDFINTMSYECLLLLYLFIKSDFQVIHKITVFPVLAFVNLHVVHYTCISTYRCLIHLQMFDHCFSFDNMTQVSFSL